MTAVVDPVVVPAAVELDPFAAPVDEVVDGVVAEAAGAGGPRQLGTSPRSSPSLSKRPRGEEEPTQAAYHALCPAVQSFEGVPTKRNNSREASVNQRQG